MAAKPKGPGRPCQDHLGNQFPSQSAMLRHYGISQTVFAYRQEKKGWGLKETLETPPQDPDMAGAHPCQDHLGNRFPSIAAMCDHWHVPRNVFFCRRKAGKPLEKCLDPVTRRREGQARTVKDHEGHEYRNLDAMCAAWGITKAQYIQNIRNNLPLGRALTERTGRPPHPKDHLGTEYPSINAMCRAWGITKTVLRSRLELGWTLREILTHPGNESHNIPCQDHTGRQFGSLKDMLQAHGVSYATYTHRMAKGLPMDQVLSKDSLHTIPCTDHEGNAFPCLQAMMRYWFVGTGTYHHRIGRQGFSLEEALTRVPEKWSPMPGIVVCPVRGRWFRVQAADGERIFDTVHLYQYLRRTAMERFIEAGGGPGGICAVQVRKGWFRLWGGSAGDAPGIVAGPDRAWLHVCISACMERNRSAKGPAPETAADGARESHHNP